MSTSYNGWPASPDKNEIGIVKFGDAAGFPFPGGIKSGDVFTVLGYVATQLHYRVEPCVNGWCWGYTYKQNVNNPSQLSCHASGTAIDWNAPDHPNGSSGTFTGSQVSTIYDILAEVRGAVSWLQGYDEMHFEICVGAGTLADVAASLPGTVPTPTPTPDPEPEIDMSSAVVLKDVDSGWHYGIAPGWFAALAMPDANGVDQYRTGVDAGLWPADPFPLNWVQIMSMRDSLCLPAPAGIYAGNDAAGNPTFR